MPRSIREAMYFVKRHSTATKEEWDVFVKKSKNGTFLLQRSYMDYHADRFDDHSLLVYDKKNQLIALVPAHTTKEGHFFSHGGLTYGGIITTEKMTTPVMLAVFDRLVDYLREKGFKKLLYKTVPEIYHSLPAQEDQYVLFLYKAELIRRDVLSVIDLQNRGPVQNRRKRGVQKAKKHGLFVNKSDRWEDYWVLLSETLNKRHNVEPVHAVQEIRTLHDSFPENIGLYTVEKDNGQILAGVVMYATKTVAHSQYIASSSEGFETCALDLLFETLIVETFKHKRYFDFGISNGENGRFLNNGLIEYKEGFGARAVTHDAYKLNLQS